MKKLNRIVFLLSLGFIGLSSCGSSSSGPNYDKVSSDTLYVKKVEDLPEGFYTGMDISSLLSLEAGGTKFYDFSGKEADLLKVIADNGVNLARVRIWNDPFDADGNGYGGGNCDINTAVEIGKRATKYGVKLLANFHYSDFWADPGRQTAPKAWAKYNLDQKADALYQYTVDSLQKLKEAKVDVAMVQVGNETNGFAMAGESGIESFAKLANKGYQAVKEVYPEAEVALHFTNPEKRGYLNVVNQLKSHNVNYDVFGSSYYPFFHGSLSNLKSQLTNAANLGKKVMVLETQYAFTDEDTDQCGNQFSSTSNYPKDYPVSIAGQANNYRNICETMTTIKDGLGIGVCYWEGAWITASPKKPNEEDGDHWTRLEQIWSKNGSGWASKYAYQYDKEAPQPSEWGHFSAGTVVDNMAFFDQNGKPVESLKVFNLIRHGNDAPIYLDGVETTSCKFIMDQTVTLPATVNGIYNDDSRKPLPVVWENVDIDALKAEGPKTTEIKGTVTSDGKKFDTICALTLEAVNYVKNPSFESGNDGSWKVELTEGETVPGQHYAMITNENGNNPITGKYSLHAWSANGPLKFKAEQTLEGINKNMTVKLRYAVTGASNVAIDKDNASQYMNVYAYILEDGEEIGRVAGYVEGYGKKLIFTSEGINLTAGKEYVVGIHADLNINGDASGFWIDFDDVSVYE